MGLEVVVVVVALGCQWRGGVGAMGVLMVCFEADLCSSAETAAWGSSSRFRC